MEDNTQTRIQSKRRRDLTALGNLVVLGLVFFHTSQIFSPFGLFIKNTPPNINEMSQRVATVFIFFVTLWGMPLMFIIAGMAVWFSLHKRTAVQFVLERVRRLLLPFLVGFLIFIPLNQYIIVKQQYPQEAGTFLQFFRAFMDLKFDLAAPIFLKSASEFFTLSHLWFLIYLFAYSLLLLPLFLYLRRPDGRRLLELAATFFTRPWAVYLLAAPLAAIQTVLGTPNALVTATWNLLAYIFFLIYGFLFASNARFEQTLWQHRKSALVLGFLGFLVYLGGFFVLNGAVNVSFGFNYSLGFILLRFVQGVTGWFWIVAILGWVAASRRRQQESLDGRSQQRPFSLSSSQSRRGSMERITAYISEAQLPFYVLHMTPIVVIGYFVVQWEVSTLMKYGVIVFSSLAATLLLYDVGVRRTRFTRFLFGIKPGAAPVEQEQRLTKGVLYKPEMPGPFS